MPNSLLTGVRSNSVSGRWFQNEVQWAATRLSASTRVQHPMLSMLQLLLQHIQFPLVSKVSRSRMFQYARHFQANSWCTKFVCRMTFPKLCLILEHWMDLWGSQPLVASPHWILIFCGTSAYGVAKAIYNNFVFSTWACATVPLV